MAHFDGHAIVLLKDEPYPEYAGWVRVDCGCCDGLEWGGYVPRTCRDCGGGGFLAKHVATGTIALYPGGPLRGRALRAASAPSEHGREETT